MERPLREVVSANGKAKKGATVTRPDWRTVGEAQDWAMEQGVFADEEEMRAQMRSTLQSIYPGRASCKSSELPPVLDSWYEEVQRRLAENAAA